jgi:hypothetical protein
MNRAVVLKSLVLAGLLLAVSLTAGAAPAYAQGGTPAFNIDSWSTDPAELQRGMEFDLTITFTNIGTFGANEVTVNIGPGGTFVGLEPGPRFGHIGIGETQTATLRVGISNTLTTGYYSIPIEFTYHHEWGTGGQAVTSGSVGVYVKGLAPSTGQDTGRPQLVIEDSSVTVDSETGWLMLTLTLHNTGNRWATGVIVNLGPSQYFSPAEGSSAFPLEGTIKVDETASLTLPLVLIQSPGERVTQDFTVEYTSPSGGMYQSQQSVPIEMSGAVARTPRLLIERYSTDPATISPGSTFRLNLELVNVGGGPAKQVIVRLGENAAALGPLAPLGSSNVRYVEQIDASTRIPLSFDLIVDGSAQAGLVALNVSLEYDDAYGVHHTEVETISLQVIAVPYFEIRLFDAVPETITVGDTFEIPIEVINIGRSMINVSTIEVVSDDLAITDGSLYVGPLDGGTSGSLVAQAEALHAGTAVVEVRVNYLDSFQQPQVVTHTLTFEINEGALFSTEGGAGPAQANTENDNSLSFGERLWRAVLGFLGLGTRPVASEVEGITNP